MLAPVSLRLAGLSGSVLHVMSRAQLREFMALFVIGSALTVAMFFLALWLMPEAAIYPFSFAAISLSRRYCQGAFEEPCSLRVFGLGQVNEGQVVEGLAHVSVVRA